MNGVITLNEIKNKVPSDAKISVLEAKGVRYGALTYWNLKTGEIPDLPLTNPNWERYVFGYGIYIFLRHNKPIYVGVADKNFKHRFQSHRSFDKRENWDWNKLARLTATHVFHNEKLAYNIDEFYGVIIPELDSFDVLRIDCTGEDLSKGQLNSIERLFKYLFNDSAWNGLEKPKGFDSNKTLKDQLHLK